MKRKFASLLVLALLPILSFAQQPDSSLRYIPKVTGLVKAKWEYSFEDNKNRFDLRNSRLGIVGNINPYVSYKMQVEYSNHGKIMLLDAFGTFDVSKSFSVSFGQVTIPFSEDYVISPSLNMFANRSFIAKFINPSSRDLGVTAEYRFDKKIPITLQGGIYNGMGINNPEWQDSPHFLGRVVYGTMKGFRTSIKYYGGKDTADLKTAQYGIDFRYATDRYKIEAEWIIKDSLDVDDSQLSGAYIQGAYNFPISNGKKLKYIEPQLRGDAMGYKVFKNGFDVSRLTLGLCFGFDRKLMGAEVRLNYEKFFFRGSMDKIRENAGYSGYFDAGSDKRLFDKFTIELLIKF